LLATLIWLALSFLAFFGFECPFVIDDAIYDSAADRTGEGCIHVINSK
jgi:hypothetical protein